MGRGHVGMGGGTPMGVGTAEGVGEEHLEVGKGAPGGWGGGGVTNRGERRHLGVGGTPGGAAGCLGSMTSGTFRVGGC